MTTTTRAQVTLSSPQSLISAIPYQLGFHPQNSMVLVGLHGKKLGLMQRIDLPPLEHAAEAATALLAGLRNDNPTSIIMIGYEDVKGESEPLFKALAAATKPLKINDILVVRNGRWYSVTCTSPTCCPPEGTEITIQPEVAEFVGRGVNPSSSRADMEARLEPHIGAVTQLPVTQLPSGWITPEAMAAWGKILTTGNITLTEAQDAAGALECIDFRDGLLATIVPGTLDLASVSKEIKAHLDTLPNLVNEDLKDNLVDLCADLSDGIAAPALTVLAVYVWNVGDGAMARVALDRALRCNPTYRLAQLVERMVDLCIRPTKTGD